MRLAAGDEQRLLAQGTNNPEAQRAYLKGLYYWNRGSDKSREYFQQAIDLDPNYAAGFDGLAHYYAFASANGSLPPKENWPKAEAAITRAWRWMTAMRNPTTFWPAFSFITTATGWPLNVLFAKGSS